MITFRGKSGVQETSSLGRDSPTTGKPSPLNGASNLCNSSTAPSTATTPSPAASDVSTPSRRLFFPHRHHVTSETTVVSNSDSSTTSSTFSFRKSSIAALGNNIRRGSLAMLGRADSGGTTNANQSKANDSPKRKKSTTTTTGAAAKKTIKRKFSAAKLAIRKISHSSQPNVASLGSNASTSPASGLGSPVSVAAITGFTINDHPIGTPQSAPVLLDDVASPCSTSSSVKSTTSRFFRILRKVSASTPPSQQALMSSSSLNPAIAALKKPLGPSLSCDIEQRRSVAKHRRFRRSRFSTRRQTPWIAARFPFRSRSPSTSSRNRILSEGCEEEKRRKKSRGSLVQAAASLLPGTRNADETGLTDGLDAAPHRGSNTLSRRHSQMAVTEDRLDLENECLHCSLGAEYRRNRLRTEIETAVKRLARRLGNRSSPNWPQNDEISALTTPATSGTPVTGMTGSLISINTPPPSGISTHAEKLRRSMGTPDIVVSSISSDEEGPDVGLDGADSGSALHRQTSGSDRCYSSYPTSGETRQESNGSACSTASPSPRVIRTTNDIFFSLEPSPTSTKAPEADWSPKPDSATSPAPNQHQPLQAMDTLKPPGFQLSPGGNNLLSPGTCSPPRSNSVDLSTLRRDIELWSISSGEQSDVGSDGESEEHNATPAESLRTLRSRSHDPTQSPDHLLRRPSRIEHLSEIFRKALAKSPVVKRAAALQEHEHKAVSKHRTSRYWLDENLTPAEHIWIPSTGPGSASSSTDTECYIGEKDCEKIGEKRRCAACHIVAHTACFPLLAKMNLVCKTTFRDSTLRRSPNKETWDCLTKHHWEVIAVACSWCKRSYHNKRSCFSLDRFDEKCDRGLLRDLILPPSWLLRLSNQRKRRQNGMVNPHRKPLKRKYRPFVVKPMDVPLSGPTQPLLVFVNPKSGGNKGSKTLHTLCWLLNPRQVFDITALKGPTYGLQIFRKIATQLRILVCGGDGTVGWTLSTLDQLNWPTYPPIAIIASGTGNDLSRFLGWGGMYSDEPLAELLSAVIHETSVTYLDRWRLDVQPNTNVDTTASPHGDSDDHPFNDAVQSTLPLTVMNNYFSIGADAHVALQFHHSRSANPQMLNSRFKNRIAYGGLGTIDLFKRTWKDLSEYITIACDDVDITHKIRESKFHCILVCNIKFYAGGTQPWGSDSSEVYEKPSSCDGKIEVIGFTSATLAALQMGGKGERIAQCSKVRVVTLKPIPMQVDELKHVILGEPCLLAASVIQLSFHSKVPMLRRDKKVVCTPNVTRKGVKSSKSGNLDAAAASTSVFMHTPVIVVGRTDFDMYRDSIDRLKDTGFEIGVISVEAEMELTQARQAIQKLLNEHLMLPYDPSNDWRFLDYVTNSEEGTFRLSRNQEQSHSVSDVSNLDECIIVLDDAFPSMTARSAAIGHDLVFTPSKVYLPASSPTSRVPTRNSSFKRTLKRSTKRNSTDVKLSNNAL
ncbi:Diacylglycerol kinase [Aphelenchoides besseyi]|nr:Diacylglycerol kinase [Aphelenchoides besseyi]